MKKEKKTIFALDRSREKNDFPVFMCRENVLKQAKHALAEKKPFRIVTVNPEFWMRARKDVLFCKAMCSADAWVRDGFGLGLLFWLRGQCAPRRVAGADLAADLLKLANARRWTVFVANRKEGLSTFSEIQKAIRVAYPNVIVEGDDVSFSEYKKEDATKKISDFFSSFEFPEAVQKAQLIFCSFGAPEQELFLQHVRCRNIPAVMMGVGGSLDFMTEKQTRASFLWRRSGLEWLYRLARQPKRIGRIMTAVFLFPIFAIGDFVRAAARR